MPETKSRHRSSLSIDLLSFTLGIIVAICVGVPVVFYGLTLSAEHVVEHAVTALVILGIVAGAVVLFLFFGHFFISKVTRSTVATASDLVESAVTVWNPQSKDARELHERSKGFALDLAHWHTYLSIRRWLVGLLIGLTAALAGYVGAVLVYREVTAIEKQVRLQSDSIQRAARAQSFSLLWDGSCEVVESRLECEGVANARTRQEALDILLDNRDWVINRHGNLDFSNAILANLDLSGRELNQATFSGAFLYGANFQGASLIDTEFSDTDISHTNFTQVVAKNAQFDNVRADDWTSFYEADLRGAWLINSQLSQVNFNKANLEGGSLGSSNVSNADFTDANLDRTNGSVCASDTIWPKGFDAAAFIGEGICAWMLNEADDSAQDSAGNSASDVAKP